MEEWEAYRRDISRRYLEHVRSLGVRQQAIQAEAERIRDMVGGLRGIDYGEPRVSASPSGDERMVSAVAAVQEATRTYCEGLVEYLEAYREARACLGAMGGKGAAALRMHYLAGIDWGAVAKRLGYSSASSARKTGESALCRLYDHLPPSAKDPLPPAI